MKLFLGTDLDRFQKWITLFKLDIDRDYFSEATLENGLLFVKLCLETDLDRIRN